MGNRLRDAFSGWGRESPNDYPLAADLLLPLRLWHRRGCFGGEIADRDLPLGDFGHAAPFANGDLAIQRNGSFNRLCGDQASVGA